MQPELQSLIHELEDLHSEMVNLVQENRPTLAQTHPENRRLQAIFEICERVVNPEVPA